jgi:ethanolamine transporter EutH
VADDNPATDRSKSGPDESKWAGIIGSVTAPIGFFALALLVIEAPFPVLFGLSQRTHNEFKWTILAMSLLIVLVVAIVALLTWKAPKNLIERIADKTAEKITASPHAMSALADSVGKRLPG